MADILSMGELLIDFTPSGTGPDGQLLERERAAVLDRERLLWKRRQK